MASMLYSTRNSGLNENLIATSKRKEERLRNAGHRLGKNTQTGCIQSE